MTSQSPRIYLYKITFEEVPYYYYGVHKEKKFNEYYMGSPKTNKWCWELYTPKKQILQLFDFMDEGWLEAQEVETRLIRPFYNTDKWCLNESCSGNFSLETRRKSGKNHYKNGIACFSLTQEERSDLSRKIGQKSYEEGKGIHSLTIEEKREIGKKCYEDGIGIHSFTIEQLREIGIKNYENGVGIHKLTIEEKREIGRKCYELGLGVHGLSFEERSNNSKKSVAITNSQRWICLETGFVTNAGALTKYQQARGIDTSKSNRKRIL
jgi:hypothetical protein